MHLVEICFDPVTCTVTIMCLYEQERILDLRQIGKPPSLPFLPIRQFTDLQAALPVTCDLSFLNVNCSLEARVSSKQNQARGSSGDELQKP